MTRVAVEAAFGSSLADVLSTGGTFTDITEFTDIINSGISITRGAENEQSQIQMGTCGLVLDNSEGRFTPEYAGSPYSPNVVDGVPLRVSVATVNTNFVRNPGFEDGSVDAWTWASGVEVSTPVTPVAHGGYAAQAIWSPSLSDYLQTVVYGLTIGATYTASAYVRVPAGDVAVRVRMGGTNSSASAVNDAYTRLTVTFTATGAVMPLQIIPSTLPAAGDKVYVDAVQVDEAATASTLNYLANSDFETGVTAWTSSGTPVVTQSATRAQRGTYALLSTWGGVASQTVTSDAFGTLTIGATYTFSAYVWVPSGHTQVQLTQAGGSVGTGNTLYNQWERITVTFTASATTHQVRIRPVVTPTNGHQVWMDAAKVEVGSSPTAYSALDGAQLHARFFGVVNTWPVRWEGLSSKVAVTATDVFSVLSRAEEQMRPMLVQESLVWGPNALYPLDEASTSTSSGNESTSAGPLSLDTVQAGSGGTLEFAAGTAPLGMSGAPLLTPASASAGKYLRAELGAGFQSASFTQQLLIEGWFATSTAGRNILSVSSPDRSYYVILYLASGTGFISVESKQPDIAVATATGGTNLADGALHHVIYDAEAQAVYVDGVFVSLTGSVLAVQDLSTLTLGASPGGGNLWNGSLSTVALYLDTSMSAASLTDHYECGTTGFSGETADERAFRLAAYVGIAFSDSGTFSTGIAEQAALGRTCLDHLQEVEGTESGKLTADRDRPGVHLQGRSVRYNPVSALTIVYPDFEPDDFVLAWDTQKVANTLLLSRPGGATQRMVHAASKAARGPIGKTIDTLCTSDLVVTDMGNWQLQRYATPSSELRGVHIQAYTMGTAAYRTLLDADVSTVFTVTTLPAQAPVSSMSVTVEGYKEDIRHNQHDLSFHTSKTNTAAVWVLDDPVYSVLGSTTRLAY
ncbi:carbohydrate binding domain-containing protein [Streptomyces turgidiscabies]|uniref:carbohydrate binding domain-containing protein n=1 Tax=Streptomyces turgidiscabies TaxID=85558 RepID=UPI0038F6F369